MLSFSLVMRLLEVGLGPGSDSGEGIKPISEQMWGFISSGITHGNVKQTL